MRHYKLIKQYAEVERKLNCKSYEGTIAAFGICFNKAVPGSICAFIRMKANEIDARDFSFSGICAKDIAVMCFDAMKLFDVCSTDELIGKSCYVVVDQNMNAIGIANDAKQTLLFNEWINSKEDDPHAWLGQYELSRNHGVMGYDDSNMMEESK